MGDYRPLLGPETQARNASVQGGRGGLGDIAWQPHLRAVTEAAIPRADERAAGLGNTLGYHLQMIGDYEAARPYYERALAIFEAKLGPEHPHTQAVRGNLERLGG